MIRAFFGGALILVTMDGDKFPRMLTQSKNILPKKVEHKKPLSRKSERAT